MSLSQQRLVIDANVIVSSVLSAQGKSRQAFALVVAESVPGQILREN
jgi:predicted nucleic acid-binding protein